MASELPGKIKALFRLTRPSDSQVTRQELCNLTAKMGKELSEVELDAIFDALDKTGDGELNFNDLVDWCWGSRAEEKEKETEKEKAEKDKEKTEEEEDSPAEKEEKAKIKKMPPKERTKYILLSGALRLLSAVWLMAQGEDYIIQRMQDLPEEAFIPPERAAELFDILGGIIVISYGWMSKKHPDPRGLHMRSVRKYLRKHKAHADGRYGEMDNGIFWDFASLPQDQPDGTKKSAAEKRVFDKGLGAINLLYGDVKTMVIQLTYMPKELPLPAEYETNLTPYNTRGWCFFEATVSGILKLAGFLLDLGVGQDALELDDNDWEAVGRASTSARHPPLTPENMTTELQTRKFTKKEHTDLAIKKYREWFEEARAGATQTLHSLQRRSRHSQLARKSASLATRH